MFYMKHLQLSSGCEMPENEGMHTSLPITYFFIQELSSERYVLQPSSPLDDTMRIEGLVKILKESEERLLWFGQPPRQLSVCWQNNGITQNKISLLLTNMVE